MSVNLHAASNYIDYARAVELKLSRLHRYDIYISTYLYSILQCQIEGMTPMECAKRLAGTAEEILEE